MSRSPRIAKLEVLLERIRSRAAAPRNAPAALASALAFDVEAEPIIRSAPPPAIAAEPQVQPELSAPVEAEVEVIESTSVVEMTIEEAFIPDPLGSRERLVAAKPVTEDTFVSDELVAEETVREEILAADDLMEVSVVKVPAEESSPEILSAVEAVEVEEEDAPVSSRRPVSVQPEPRLVDLAFGTDEPNRPPRHTPPPESGRLPAAPELKLGPEPEFEGDITAVRPAASIVAVEPVRMRELTPEATRAAPAPNDAVVEVVEAAQRFAPTTFAALLDASLAL